MSLSKWNRNELLLSKSKQTLLPSTIILYYPSIDQPMNQPRHITTYLLWTACHREIPHRYNQDNLCDVYWINIPVNTQWWRQSRHLCRMGSKPYTVFWLTMQGLSIQSKRMIEGRTVNIISHYRSICIFLVAGWKSIHRCHSHLTNGSPWHPCILAST